MGATARLYREAIELDPMNADALAGLSLTLIAQGLMGSLHPSNVYEPAKAALRQAMELDPGLLEVIRAEAWLKMLVDRDWDGARDCFDDALRRCRTSVHTLVGRAMLHISEGSIQEAHGLLLEAARYKPLSTVVVTTVCWCEYLAGRLDAALALVAQARKSGHQGALLDAIEALASIQMSEPCECVPRLELLVAESPHHYTLQGVLGYAYGVTGRIQDARGILEILTEPGLLGKCDYEYPSALTLLGLNERRKAIECLLRSYRHGSLWSLGFNLDPILAPLRNDPYFILPGYGSH